MRSGRIQNPIAFQREWENEATERQNRIVRVALRRMMVFSQPCGSGTTRMIRGDFSSISARCGEALCFFLLIDGKRLFSP
jgi:NAD dependent epimerase/dehydratase family enzyme